MMYNVLVTVPVATINASGKAVESTTEKCLTKAKAPINSKAGDCKMETFGTYVNPLTSVKGGPYYTANKNIENCHALVALNAAKNTLTDMYYSFDTTLKKCTIYTKPSLPSKMIGQYDYLTCTVTPKWTNPDPPNWKSVIGNCQRIDFGKITNVIDEDKVADKAACAALCTNNISKCEAYEFIP